ncbi:Dynein light chain 2, cytoplasmic [Glycine soja]|nr:Dynein light chain 2, cytoplasmic [Glycine soja]
MSEEAKKNFAGALTARPNSDEPKPAPVPAVPPKKVIIKSADMIPDMQKEAVDIAVAAFEKYNVEKDVAEQIKKEFDKRHGPTWHCIVGRNFGWSLFALKSVIDSVSWLEFRSDAET